MHKFDVLEALINWIDQEIDETTEVWDRYLRIVLKDFTSQHEPSPDMWAEIKAKIQREVVLNQVHSCSP